MNPYDNPKGWKLPPNPSTSQRICVKFKIPDTEEYRRATAGAVTELAKWHNWERDVEQGAKIASQLFRATILEQFEFVDCEDGGGTEDMPLDFMQDGCKLYYSNDGRITWFLMFDYEECFNSLGDGNVADDITINNYYDQNAQNAVDAWNNGERPDDGDIDPIFWDVAVCLAVYSIVDSVLSELVVRRNAVNNTDVIGTIVGGIVGGVGALNLFLKAVTWKIQLAVSLLAIGWGAFQYISRDEIGNIPEEEFSNANLKSELRAVMYNALRGIAPSLLSYTSSLDAVQPVTPNALTIRDYIKEGLTLESFIGFLQLVRILHDFAKAENFLENACNQLEWSHIFRFDTAVGSSHSFVSRLSGASTRTTDGWVSSGTTFGTYKEAGTKRTLNLQQSALRSITIEYYSANPKNTQGAWAWHVGIAGSIYELPDGTGNLFHTIDTVRTGTIDLYVLMHFRSTLANNNCRIKAIIMSGTGVNPFS